MENKINPEELLRAGTPIQIVPSGYSMYPLVNPNKGDAVVLEPLGERTLKKREVVLFRRNSLAAPGAGDILVLHRIVRISGEDFFLVGDNQCDVEGPVNRSQICGVMTAVVKKGRSISVTDLRYRLSCGVWHILLPVRPALLRFASWGKRTFSRR